jgi:putative PIN family toxin of toxin-antitoxin system
MKLLVDTSVLVSAALRDRLPERVVLAIAAREEWIWIATPEILAEYVDVLRRPKFNLSAEVISQWSELLRMRVVQVPSPPTADSVHFPRDPKDAPFLAAALAYDADWLVTGDRDLLAAGRASNTRIASISEFAREFQITQ